MDGLKVSVASCVTRKTRSLGALVLCSICIIPERDKKKSVTATLYEDSERLVVSKKQGCDWGACGRLIKILKNVIGRNHDKI